MTLEEKAHQLLRFAQIRRAKFWLRFMPRRARFHTYPLVGRFAAFGRKRSFLWRFSYPQIRPAFYFGSVLTLLPIPGQVLISFFLCILLRTNFMIMGALQFVTNPATSLPLLIGTYKLGAITLDLTGLSVRREASPAIFSSSSEVPLVVNPPPELAPADLEAPPPALAPTPWVDRFYRVLGDLLPPRGKTMATADWLRLIAHIVASLVIGAIIGGLLMGAVLDLLWRWFILPAARHHAARKPVTAIITPHSAPPVGEAPLSNDQTLP